MLAVPMDGVELITVAYALLEAVPPYPSVVSTVHTTTSPTAYEEGLSTNVEALPTTVPPLVHS